MTIDQQNMYLAGDGDNSGRFTKCATIGEARALVNMLKEGKA